MAKVEKEIKEKDTKQEKKKDTKQDENVDTKQEKKKDTKQEKKKDTKRDENVDTKRDENVDTKQDENVDTKELKKKDKQDGKVDTKGQKKKDATKEVKKDISKPKDELPDIKYIVRIADTDLDGKRSVQYALTGIKGVGRRIAKVISAESNIDPTTTLGYLYDADIDKLKASVDSIISIVPYWMVNKQNDFMTGDDKHAIGTDIILSTNEDINVMKKMRSYKGLRHERGLRVRGQRTRSTGRKGRTVGVTRATLSAAKAAEKKEGEKKEEKKVSGK